MPGSSNFVGEFLILLGVFNAKIVIAIIAFTGVVLASVYALRLFIRAMHNRVGPERRVARDDAAPTALVLVPLVLVDPRASRCTRSSRCERSERSVDAAIAPTAAGRRPRAEQRGDRREESP